MGEKKLNALEIIGAEALRMIEAGEATLIDVRTPVEFSSLHALPAKNLPINLLTKERLEEIAQLKKIIFICQSGGRGKKAVELATGFGFSPSNVSGGTLA